MRLCYSLHNTCCCVNCLLLLFNTRTITHQALTLHIPENPHLSPGSTPVFPVSEPQYLTMSIGQINQWINQHIKSVPFPSIFPITLSPGHHLKSGVLQQSTQETHLLKFTLQAYLSGLVLEADRARFGLLLRNVWATESLHFGEAHSTAHPDADSTRHVSVSSGPSASASRSLSPHSLVDALKDLGETLWQGCRSLQAVP